jgi:phage host-nuclease inhibitor protein Gam
MKIKIPKFKSREEFIASVDAAARLTVEIRSMEAARDRRVQQIQDEYAGALDVQESQLIAIVAQAEKFAEEHQCELMLGKARSAETALARYGFRVGMPQLKTLAKWTWKKALREIQALNLDCFVRSKPELDRAAIIGSTKEGQLCFASATIGSIPLSNFGMKVVQEEAFFIDPKVDGAEQVKPAAK